MATTRDYENFVQKFIAPKVTDITFNSTPMLNRFYSKAKASNFSPRGIQEPLEITTGIAGTYSDLEKVDTSRKEIMHYAEYAAKYYYAALSISHQDELTWGSNEAIVDGIKVKTNNAMKTLRKNIAADIATGDGTTKNIIGLNSAIASTDTTYGGLAEATYTDWVPARNNVNGVITIPDVINTCVKASDGNDQPTILMTDKFIWGYLWTLLQPQERYQGGKPNMIDNLPAVSGFPMLHDAVFESSGATGGLLYAINEDYLYLRIHSKDNMKRWPMEKPHGQFAYSTYWTICFALCCNNRKRQAVGYGISVA